MLTSQCEIVPIDDSDEEFGEIDSPDIANPFASERKKMSKHKVSNSFISSGLRVNTQTSDSKRNQLSRNIYEANKL